MTPCSSVDTVYRGLGTGTTAASALGRQRLRRSRQRLMARRQSRLRLGPCLGARRGNRREVDFCWHRFQGAIAQTLARDVGPRGDVENQFPNRVSAGDRMRRGLLMRHAVQQLVERRSVPHRAGDRALDVVRENRRLIHHITALAFSNFEKRNSSRGFHGKTARIHTKILRANLRFFSP